MWPVVLPALPYVRTTWRRPYAAYNAFESFTSLLSLGGPQMEVIGWYHRVTIPDNIILVVAVGCAGTVTHVTVPRVLKRPL